MIVEMAQISEILLRIRLGIFVHEIEQRRNPILRGDFLRVIKHALQQRKALMAVRFPRAAHIALPTAGADADGANHGADHMEGRLLSGLKQNPYITQTDLANELSLSRRTVQRIMKELMNDGKIKRVGSTRTGHWEIND